MKVYFKKVVHVGKIFETDNPDTIAQGVCYKTTLLYGSQIYYYHDYE